MLSRKTKGSVMEPFCCGSPVSELEVNDCRKYRCCEQEHQPLEIVSRQKSGEMQDEGGNCQHIEQSKQHGVFPFSCSATGSYQLLLGYSSVIIATSFLRECGIVPGWGVFNGWCYPRKRMERSRARTSLVKPPIEMRSTPVSAIPRSVSRLTFPDASSTARPALIDTASRI